MDKDLIECIKATLAEIWDVKERIRKYKSEKKKVPSYLRTQLRWLDKSLNQMRSVAVYYKEYSSIENLQLLGENYRVECLVPGAGRGEFLEYRTNGSIHDAYSSFSLCWHSNRLLYGDTRGRACLPHALLGT